MSIFPNTALPEQLDTRPANLQWSHKVITDKSFTVVGHCI